MIEYILSEIDKKFKIAKLVEIAMTEKLRNECPSLNCFYHSLDNSFQIFKEAPIDVHTDKEFLYLSVKYDDGKLQFINKGLNVSEINKIKKCLGGLL